MEEYLEAREGVLGKYGQEREDSLCQGEGGVMPCKQGTTSKEGSGKEESIGMVLFCALCLPMTIQYLLC